MGRFFHSQDGAGGCAVVAEGGEAAGGGEFYRDGLDAEGDVGFAGGGGLGLDGVEQGGLGFQPGGRLSEGQATELEEVASGP